MAGPKPTGDMHVRDFVRVLQRLESHLPISDAFESDLPQRRGSWWSSQKEHLIQWFGDQETYGSGAFAREVRNTSARTTYSRLLSAPAFVWLAEALGEDPAVVSAAANAARAEPNPRRRPGILRGALPWERIFELAQLHR